MITRRQFIAAGTVAACGSAATAEILGPRRVLHKIGLVTSPDHRVPASGWPVSERTLTSFFMAGPVPWAFARPLDTKVDAALVCLHGRDGNHRQPFDTLYVHDVAASLGLNVAVVGVNGTDASYWHQRASGIDPLKMLLQELLPTVFVEVGTPNVALLGWSMGGYAALLVAEAIPERCRCAVAVSPALWPDFAHSAPGAFDDQADFDRFDVFRAVDRLTDVPIRIDCGTDDGFVSEARRFASLLKRPNLGAFTPGFHDNRYWRSMLPAQLRTIAATLP